LIDARMCLGTGLVLIVLLSMAACGGDEPAEPAGSSGNPAASAKPTKEALVAVLRNLQASLDAKDYPAAVTSLVAFPGMTDEQMQKAVAGFVEKREVSAEGIAVLEAKGRYGPLLEVFPDRGENFAKKAGVDAATCYAMALDVAEVAAHWDGKAFRLIRLDDVGKLD